MTKREFIKRVNELGCQFENNGTSCSIDAPSGYVFKSYGTHSETLVFYDGWMLSEIYNEFYRIMANGVVKCDLPNCEICNN